MVVRRNWTLRAGTIVDTTQPKKAMAAGRYDEARRFAEAAEVEAELAEAKADAEITWQAADRLRRTIDALRQELERSPARTTSKE